MWISHVLSACNRLWRLLQTYVEDQDHPDNELKVPFWEDTTSPFYRGGDFDCELMA